jgi:DNA polymerase-3 subunit epsilon
MIYAITDIETTGGQPSGNSIIEIGVILWDGNSILDEFHSLIDPGIPVPLFITRLTGITSEMVSDAPTFDVIADRLQELFDGAVFVAHNVNFDYSFIKAEFAAIGRNWSAQRLCTVRLARKAFPGQKSYGLSSICSWMGLHNEQAHRALSDARMAAEILRRSFQQLSPEAISAMLSKDGGAVFLPPNLPEKTFNRLPESPGVYYLYNEKGKPLYIGKANNIKKRVKQHFTTKSETARAQSFMREVHDVGFELSGNELIALLLEDAEIRKHWPPHNSAQKRKIKRRYVIRYTDQKGYNRLASGSESKTSGCVKSFASSAEANRWLHGMASEFGIDPRLLGLAMFDVGVEPPSVEFHNEALDRAITAILSRDESYVIAGPGRAASEHGYIWVEKGVLQGYAFLEDHITNADDLLFHLKPLPHSENTNSILDAFTLSRWGYRRIDCVPPNLV